MGIADRFRPNSSESRCAATVLKKALGSAVDMGGTAKAVFAIKTNTKPQSKTLSLLHLPVLPTGSIPEIIVSRLVEFVSSKTAHMTPGEI